MKTTKRPERAVAHARFLSLAARLGALACAAPDLDALTWSALDELTDLARAGGFDLGPNDDRLRRTYMAASGEGADNLAEAA